MTGTATRCGAKRLGCKRAAVVGLVAAGLAAWSAPAAAQSLFCRPGLTTCPGSMLCIDDGRCANACGPGGGCASGCCRTVSSGGRAVQACVDASACASYICTPDIVDGCGDRASCASVGYGFTCMTRCTANADCGGGCCVRSTGGFGVCVSDANLCGCRTPGGVETCELDEACGAPIRGPLADEDEAEDDDEDAESDEEAASEAGARSLGRAVELDLGVYACRRACANNLACGGGCCLASTAGSSFGVCAESGESCTEFRKFVDTARTITCAGGGVPPVPAAMLLWFAAWRRRTRRRRGS